MTNIEQLKKETDEIKKWLEELKNNVSISESEKKTKAEELKTKAESTKHKIESEIASLSEKTDDESKRKKEEAETLLNTFNETVNLYASVLASSETKPEEEKKETTDTEKKWFFKKTGEWIWEQRDDVWSKEKWEKELWINLLRTAWFVATWVWAISLAVKWIKKLFWKDKKKESDSSDSSKDKEEKKKPRRKKFLVWSAIAAGTVVWWVEIYKNWNLLKSYFKEKLWLALGFEEALTKVENEVKNWKVDTQDFWTFRAHFEWITYDENTQEVSSFWEKTKINKNTKSIDWMDVKFASWEELFHAVNIVNFAKRELAWRWATENPFTKNSTSWDIEFNVSENWNSGFMSADWSDFRTKVLWLGWAGTGGLLWWYFLWVKWALVWGVWAWLAWYTLWSIIDNTSTLWRECSTIRKWATLDKFVNYLNGLNVRKWKPQEKEPDVKSPIHPYLNKVIYEIENEFWSRQKRDLWLEYDEKNPSEVLIKSYHQKVKLKLEWNVAKVWENLDFTKITKISILKYDNNDRWDGLDIDFPHTEDWLKEAIRVANLTNMLREKFKNTGHTRYPFWYWRYSTSMWFDIMNEKKVEIAGGINVDISGVHWTVLLENTTLNDKYPTILKDLKKSPRFLWLPTLGSQFWSKSDQKKQHEQARNDKPEWSQYIKYLNQMGCWEYRWEKSSTN